MAKQKEASTQAIAGFSFLMGIITAALQGVKKSDQFSATTSLQKGKIIIGYESVRKSRKKNVNEIHTCVKLTGEAKKTPESWTIEKTVTEFGLIDEYVNDKQKAAISTHGMVRQARYIYEVQDYQAAKHIDEIAAELYEERTACPK